MRGKVRAWLSRWLEPELFQPFLLGVFLSLTLSEFVRGALVYSVLPTYGSTVLGFAVEWVTLALSVHYFVDNILRSPVGWLIDRLGPRPVLLAGFALAACAMYGMMQARSIQMLLLSAAVFGIGVTPVWPSAVAAIGLASPEQKRGTFMSYMYMFWLAGAGLGPVLINFVVARSYRPAFWVMVLAECGALALIWGMVRRRPQAFSRHDPALYGKSHADEGHHTPTPSLSVAYLRDLWRNVRDVAFLFPGMFAQMFAVSTLVPILSLYARVVLHLSAGMYSGLLVFGGAFAVLLMVPGGRMVDRLGSRWFLVGAFAICAACLLIYPTYHRIGSTFVMVAVVGICYAFILPAWNSVLDHSIDPDKKATIWGVFMTIEGMGSALGPYVGGLLWDGFGPSAPFWFCGAIIALMAGLYAILPIEKAAHNRRMRQARRADFAANPGGSSLGAACSVPGTARTSTSTARSVSTLASHDSGVALSGASRKRTVEAKARAGESRSLSARRDGQVR
ncbi:MAG: MFS transporter [Alicyclobacillus herbarius]|uniref:MFS transporter n=1 Tax=Alicyclobacillus herbarius TaxID=122960 RepID=UPI002356C071|nr:MFS transporter [Alicyclobacillus herbarius]MCL6632993.1 MFS transporter [Alicyclobacillus herbarius]